MAARSAAPIWKRGSNFLWIHKSKSRNTSWETYPFTFIKYRIQSGANICVVMTKALPCFGIEHIVMFITRVWNSCIFSHRFLVAPQLTFPQQHLCSIRQRGSQTPVRFLSHCTHWQKALQITLAAIPHMKKIKLIISFKLLIVFDVASSYAAPWFCLSSFWFAAGFWPCSCGGSTRPLAFASYFRITILIPQSHMSDNWAPATSKWTARICLKWNVQRLIPTLVFTQRVSPCAILWKISLKFLSWIIDSSLASLVIEYQKLFFSTPNDILFGRSNHMTCRLHRLWPRLDLVSNSFPLVSIALKAAGSRKLVLAPIREPQWPLRRRQ